MAQVRENTESTTRQYALAEEAVRLGWPRAKVEVVDADLGLSGRSAEHRDGFKDLVGRVCLGEVRAVFGLEISRFARSSADPSRLLELARLTGTLVVDADGVYDLSDFNDRMLLGLKDQWSEAELHYFYFLLRLSPPGGQESGCRAGRTALPVARRLCLRRRRQYSHRPSTVIDPDAEVQAAVRDLFASFRSGGSAYQVVAASKRRRFP
jgi:hypothetical protein